MVYMFVFWVIYGLWFVSTWSGLVCLLACVCHISLSWVTDDDYNLGSVMHKITCLLECAFTFLILFFGSIYLVTHTIVYTVDSSLNKTNTRSFHEVSVIVAEWFSVNMTTPITIVVLISGMLLLAKKSYPTFKKVKNAIDKLD